MAESADSKSSWDKQESWKDPHSYLKHTGANSLVKREPGLITPLLSHPVTQTLAAYFMWLFIRSIKKSESYRWFRRLPVTFSAAAVHSSVSHQPVFAVRDSLCRLFLWVNSTGTQNWNLSHFLFLFFMAVLTLVKLCVTQPLASANSAGSSRISSWTSHPCSNPRFYLSAGHLHTTVSQVPWTPQSQSQTHLSS